MKIARIIILVLLLIAPGIGLGANIRISVDPPRGKRGIAVGDKFYVTYTLSDMDETLPKPASIPGGKLAYFQLTGQSTQMSIVNGRTSQSTAMTYTATVVAVKEGKFSIGPISLGGVKSNKVTYTIGAKGSNESPIGPGRGPDNRRGSANSLVDQNAQGPQFIGKGDEDLFLRASVSKTTAYEQEALVYTVKLYSTYANIKFIGAAAAPKFEGFVIEESKDVSEQLSFETYNHKSYATAVIARYIIFPQMTGKLKILGNKYTVSVDAREYYHDPFFGQLAVSKPLQLNVAPNDLTIDVKALPQPQPADFSGGVGRFSIASSFPNKKLLTNQAAPVVYTVTGSGNIKYVKLPDLNSIYPAELEVFSPQTDVKADVESSTVSGRVRFDYSVMPEEKGVYEIPPIKLVYFNPATGKYETSVAKGTTVSVGQGKASAKSQSHEKVVFNDKLKPVGSNLAKIHTPMVSAFSYWLFYIVPTVLLVTAVIMYRRRLKALSDLELLRSKKADKVARKRLKAAALCIKKDDSSRFYDEMLLALWGYLGDKLRIPTSELTRDNVTEKLRGRGVDDSVADRLVSLVDDCEYAKYAPAAAKGDMPEVYARGTEIINQLEDSFKQNKR